MYGLVWKGKMTSIYCTLGVSHSSSSREISSLVTQPPKTHVKKGSGNIVYNELSQRNSIIAYIDTLECN